MRISRTIALVAGAMAPTAQGQRQCKKGIPCGGTCISATKTCHVGQQPARDTTTRRDSLPPRAARVLTPLLTVSSSADSLWMGSVDGTIYYWAACATAQKLTADERVYFRTPEEAESQRYKRSRARGC